MPVISTPRRLRAVTLAVGLAYTSLSLLSCATGEEYSGPLPTPDGARFVTDVYPLLLRDCAFVECHGKPERFFRIVGPGRARLDPAIEQDDPVTFAEVQLTYERAQSMLASSKNLEDSLLLRKPLEIGEGGQGHKGLDDLGRNVFSRASDPRYVALLAWAKSSGPPPTAAGVAAASAAVEQQEEADL